MENQRHQSCLTMVKIWLWQCYFFKRGHLGSISRALTLYVQLHGCRSQNCKKNTVKLSNLFFSLLGYVRIKGARKMLMKLSPGCKDGWMWGREKRLFSLDRSMLLLLLWDRHTITGLGQDGVGITTRSGCRRWSTLRLILNSGPEIKVKTSLRYLNCSDTKTDTEIPTTVWILRYLSILNLIALIQIQIPRPPPLLVICYPN